MGLWGRGIFSFLLRRIRHHRRHRRRRRRHSLGVERRAKKRGGATGIGGVWIPHIHCPMNSQRWISGMDDGGGGVLMMVQQWLLL